MKSIHKIITEEVVAFLSENDEAAYAMYDAEDNIKQEIFDDFLWHNNANFTKNIAWQVVPFARLKKTWENYMKMGTVRDVKSLESIERIVIRNALKIDVITALAGHTQGGDEEAIEDNIGGFVNEQLNCLLPQEKVDTSQLEIPYDNPEQGYEKKKNLPDPEPCRVQVHPFIQEQFNEIEETDRNKVREILYDKMQEQFFEYYLVDPESGHIYLSDYGLAGIITQTAKLYSERNPEKKVILIDSILNIVHQRSDLASWFVQGGSSALSNLSGYEVPDEEAGGYDTKSAISGRYKMADYR